MMLVLLTIALLSQDVPSNSGVLPVVSPRALGDPAKWITSDDYPREAIEAKESGDVGFALDVDSTGAVTDCTIWASSNSKILDTQTCALMRERARFDPARDKDGKGVSGSYRLRIRWQLPRAARPTSDPQTWISNEDYPGTDESGVVNYILDIAVTGAVTNCSPSSSTNSALLEAHTCRLLRERARFEPATGGDARPGTYRGRVRWERPTEALPLTPFSFVARYRLSADGTLASCTLQMRVGELADPGGACADALRLPQSLLLEIRGAARRPVEIIAVVNQVVGGQGEPFQPPLDFVSYSELRSSFDVDEQGKISNCLTTGRSPIPEIGLPDLCDGYLSYEPSSPPISNKGELTVAIFTNGEPEIPPSSLPSP